MQIFIEGEKGRRKVLFFLQKMHRIFAYVKKKQYLCTLFLRKKANMFNFLTGL